jgi:hypothetical protein
VTIQPASLRDKNGEEKYFYPSKREELVEDALRKFRRRRDKDYSSTTRQA